jgi:hypothetical protein
MEFKDADFRSSDLIRLEVLQKHLEMGRINDRLEWLQFRPERTQGTAPARQAVMNNQ